MSFHYKNTSEARKDYNEAMDQKAPKPYFALLIAQRNLDQKEMVAPLRMLLAGALKKNDIVVLQDLVYRYDTLIEKELKEHIVEKVVEKLALKGDYIEAVDYVLASKDCSAQRLSVEFHSRAMQEKRYDVAAIMWDRYKIGPDNMNEAAAKLYLSQERSGDIDGALLTIKMYKKTLEKYLLPVLLMKAQKDTEKFLSENLEKKKEELPEIKVVFRESG